MLGKNLILPERSAWQVWTAGFANVRRRILDPNLGSFLSRLLAHDQRWTAVPVQLRENVGR